MPSSASRAFLPILWSEQYCSISLISSRVIISFPFLCKGSQKNSRLQYAFYRRLTSNYRNPSLHIWTRVGDEFFEDTKFQIDYDVAQRHFNGQITDEEFVNAVFEPQEQVSDKQAELLGAAFTLAAGGPAEVHVGTGSGGSSSNLPWGEQKKGNRR